MDQTPHNLTHPEDLTDLKALKLVLDLSACYIDMFPDNASDADRAAHKRVRQLVKTMEAQEHPGAVPDDQPSELDALRWVLDRAHAGAGGWHPALDTVKALVHRVKDLEDHPDKAVAEAFNVLEQHGVYVVSTLSVEDVKQQLADDEAYVYGIVDASELSAACHAVASKWDDASFGTLIDLAIEKAFEYGAIKKWGDDD